MIEHPNKQRLQHYNIDIFIFASQYKTLCIYAKAGHLFHFYFFKIFFLNSKLFSMVVSLRRDLRIFATETKEKI